MFDLRASLIRLAHAHPEFRGDLLPVLKEAGTYQEYVERKKKQNKPPMKKDEWEARTNGGTQGGEAPSKEHREITQDNPSDSAKQFEEITKKDKTKIKSLVEKAESSGSPQTHKTTTNTSGRGGANKHTSVTHVLPGGKAVMTWKDEFTPVKGEKSIQHYSAVGDVAEDGTVKIDQKTRKNHKGDADAASEAAAAHIDKLHTSKKKDEAKKPKDKKPSAPKEDKPAKEKSYAKKYHKTVETVMDKHNLTDDDADQVKAWKKDKPNHGKPITDAEKLRRFLAKAKPETKERMKGMNPADFVKMLGAIMDDGEGGGKTANWSGSMNSTDIALRNGLIRIAHAHPEHRAALLPIIKQAGFDAGTIGKEVAGPKQSESDESYMKGHFKQDRFTELGKKQESGSLPKADTGKTAADRELRAKLIRFAHANPAHRADILGLLAE